MVFREEIGSFYLRCSCGSAAGRWLPLHKLRASSRFPGRHWFPRLRIRSLSWQQTGFRKWSILRNWVMSKRNSLSRHRERLQLGYGRQPHRQDRKRSLHDENSGAPARERREIQRERDRRASGKYTQIRLGIPVGHFPRLPYRTWRCLGRRDAQPASNRGAENI